MGNVSGCSDDDFLARNGSMQGAPYKDSSGTEVDSMLLVYRISLPEGMKQL